MSRPESSLFRMHLNRVRRWWPIGVVVAGVVLAGLIPFAAGLPGVYRSSASLLVDQAPDPLGDPDAGLVELSGRLQAIRLDALNRQRALALAEEFDLYPEERRAGQVDAVVARLERNVTVEPAGASRTDGQTSMVSFRVSFTGTDPVKVAAVTNRLAQFYVQRNRVTREQQAARTVASLKQELDATRGQLMAHEDRIADFTTRHVGTLPAQMQSITTKYSQLMAQLQAGSAEMTLAMERRDALQSTLTVLSTGGAGADTADPVVRLAQAERELTALTDRFTDRSVEVRSKRNEIAGLQAQVAGRVGTNAPAPNDALGVAPTDMSMSSTLQGQIAAWNRRIASLQKRNDEIQVEMAKYDAIIARAPVRNAEFDRINSEVAMTRSQYGEMQARYRAARAMERAQKGGGRDEFQLVDSALPAESPSAPNRRVLVVLVMLLAAGLGLGAVLLADGLDETFQSVDELKAFTTVPVLASIPLIVSEEPGDREVKKKRMLRVAAAVSVGLLIIGVGAFQLAQQAEAISRMLLR